MTGSQQARTLGLLPPTILVALLLLVPLAGAQLPLPLPTVAGPEQVHVTATGEGGLVVQWALLREYGSGENPTVWWSVDGGAEQTTRGALAGVAQPSGGPLSAERTPTYVYAATLENVPGGATVEYRVGVEGQRSAPFTIRQLPDATSAVRFVAYGDIGIDCAAPDGSAVTPDCAAHIVRDLAIAEDPDLFIIPGDLAYRNTRAGWDTFMRFMQPIQSTVVTMPVIGNHEWEDGIGYHYFLEHYVLPRDEHDFAFSAGPVNFIAFNSERLCGEGRWSNIGSRAVPCNNGPVNVEAIAWLEDALIEASSNDLPWTVVYMHFPPYSWGSHGDNFPAKHFLKPLFERYGVDVVVAAHDHLYSRTHPILGDLEPVVTGSEYVQGVGIVYLVAGGGGRGLYDQPDGEPPAHYASAERLHGFTVFDVDANRLSFRAIDSTGREYDAFAIVRGPSAVPAGDDVDLPIPGPAASLLVAAFAAAAALVVRRRGGEA